MGLTAHTEDGCRLYLLQVMGGTQLITLTQSQTNTHVAQSEQKPD